MEEEWKTSARRPRERRLGDFGRIRWVLLKQFSPSSRYFIFAEWQRIGSCLPIDSLVGFHNALLSIFPKMSSVVLYPVSSVGHWSTKILCDKNNRDESVVVYKVSVDTYKTRVYTCKLGQTEWNISPPLCKQPRKIVSCKLKRTGERLCAIVLQSSSMNNSEIHLVVQQNDR